MIGIMEVSKRKAKKQDGSVPSLFSYSSSCHKPFSWLGRAEQNCVPRRCPKLSYKLQTEKAPGETPVGIGKG